MKKSTKMTARGVLDRLLDPLSATFTPAAARRIAGYRADAVTRARIEELADKCTEGQLTATERREYEASVRAILLISVLQSKARVALARNRKTR